MKNNYSFDGLRRVCKQKTEMYTTRQIGWLAVQGIWLGLVSQSVTWHISINITNLWRKYEKTCAKIYVEYFNKLHDKKRFLQHVQKSEHIN